MDLVLKEVTRKEDFIRIRSELQLFLPETELMSMIIDMRVRYPLKFTVFHYQRTTEERSHLVIVTGTPSSKILPNINIFWNYEQLEENDAVVLLGTLPNWNWKKPFCLHAVTDKYLPKVKKLFQHKKLVGGSLVTDYDVPQSSYFLEDVKRVNHPGVTPPQGFKFGSLRPEHLPAIFEVAQFTALLDLKTFQENVTILPSVAIYKDDDANESYPLSWMILHEFGYIGFTYTLPDYRRLGLSTLVMTRLIQIISKMGHRILVHIVDDNKDSIRYHKKFGFAESVHNTCSFFLPQGVSLDDYSYNNSTKNSEEEES